MDIRIEDIRAEGGRVLAGNVLEGTTIGADRVLHPVETGRIVAS